MADGPDMVEDARATAAVALDTVADGPVGLAADGPVAAMPAVTRVAVAPTSVVVVAVTWAAVEAMVVAAATAVADTGKHSKQERNKGRAQARPFSFAPASS